jgi:aryl-alcohol dehydrogenase-like predicted oxidoreductase
MTGNRVVRLGGTGLEVSALGLGCMGMSGTYGQRDPADAVQTINRALDLGVRMFDTANVYGSGENEELLGRALGARREEAVIATKFGLEFAFGRPVVRGDADYVRTCCDESLRRLGTDRIDLYYQHRVDPAVPVEESVGAMAELVTAGKVRYLGLSEASASLLERAAAVHPIAALQSEWSLWTRDIEAEILPAARRLSIGLVPFSPLGRGFLTATINGDVSFEQADFRSRNPRFQGENLARNVALMAQVSALAAAKGCTPAQLALAWLLAQGGDICPIPGTTRVANLEQNTAALGVMFTSDELARLEGLSPPGAWVGARY